MGRTWYEPGVEIVGLPSFRNDVRGWPQTEVEASLIAERLLKLFKAPFVVLRLTDPKEWVITKYGQAGADAISADLLHEFLKKQASSQDGFASIPAHVQLTRENAPWAGS